MEKSALSQLLGALALLRKSARGDDLRARAKADPEDQLKTPVKTVVESAGADFRLVVETRTEARHPESGTRPDIAVFVGKLLCGYIELKAPGKGAQPSRFSNPHDREQWKKFKALPNLIYTDGREWSLARNGKIESALAAKTSGEIDAEKLSRLLRDFLQWQPKTPGRPRPLAEYLAPLCRMIRDDVLRSLSNSNSAISSLAKEWRGYFFPDADDAQFADAYAQTLTFALLLARLEGVREGGMGAAVEKLQKSNNLLAQALRILGHEQARQEINPGADLLMRSLDALEIDLTRKRADASDMFDYGPELWLYFYEDFLAVYDPALRKNSGVYYTPAQVVQCQIRLVSQLLRDKFGKDLSFADDGVTFLDPAVGTGAYLVAAAQHGLGLVKAERGKGAVKGRAERMAKNMFGFEILMGAYAVAHMRLANEFKSAGADLPEGRALIYLADALSSPYKSPPAELDLTHRVLTDEHEQARRIKKDRDILVCMGNPPYNRQSIDPADGSVARKGGWVRYGEENGCGNGDAPILEDFLRPAREIGKGRYLKNLYNDYVYFWRWALWKMFEARGGGGDGIVSFITPSSYLEGDAFVGMRQVMRELFDELWIIDLGGEGRGARKSPNVFAIQTPVAIAIGYRKGAGNSRAATARYLRIEGATGKEKLARLDGIKKFSSEKWKRCPSAATAPLKPHGEGDYFAWPKLTDILPWQHSGVQFKRTWPIGESVDVLRARWSELMRLSGSEQKAAFREEESKKVDGVYRDFSGQKLPALSSLSVDSPSPPIIPYSFRVFDRQYALLDNRVCSRWRPPLLFSWSGKQVFLSSLLAGKMSGAGPGAVATCHIPDLHHFASGGKDVVPLWRDAQAAEPNLNIALWRALEKIHRAKIAADDLFAYCCALLAAPDYASRFAVELEAPGPRIPMTRNAKLFAEIARLGRRLICLHTDGERMPAGGSRSRRGRARCETAVSGDEENYPHRFRYCAIEKAIFIGDGKFAPVEAAVWDFEVAGSKIVQHWIKRRMRKGAGKISSPLDEIRPASWDHSLTEDFLALLWKVEKTIEIGGELSRALEKAAGGKCVPAADLPLPAESELLAPLLASAGLPQQFLEKTRI